MQEKEGPREREEFFQVVAQPAVMRARSPGGLLWAGLDQDSSSLGRARRLHGDARLAYGFSARCPHFSRREQCPQCAAQLPRSWCSTLTSSIRTSSTSRLPRRRSPNSPRCGRPPPSRAASSRQWCDSWSTLWRLAAATERREVRKRCAHGTEHAQGAATHPPRARLVWNSVRSLQFRLGVHFRLYTVHIYSVR